ncbi:hypothetical protein BKA82DRAFT_3971020 [Pisolithus tinctorius]|uniref:G-protein coupled receptors family 1 profile domain-containing protein n=1 Tax=Pisolithus tinctorius Marx 270 TaxID=870435 RepID=A0A0C3KBV1_PISTI|nr:hypothetical protein BKA82DRAFT_3971020 [Pisolithus tinctorius]KIO07117.1 hypothetical protein M404DRAFT_137581 [Pisolithus tinctorius Marx 270]
MSSVTGAESTINAFVEAIHPSFDYLLSCTAFSACLFTLLVVLFAFSTHESRRRAVFRLNVFAICLTLTLGILTGLSNGKAITDPFHQVPKGVYIATAAFSLIPPLLYDSILLSRLFALYPVSTTPRATLLKIFAFPFCIKCARVVVIALGLSDFVRSGMNTSELVQNELATWFQNPKPIAEWSMQVADNLYSVSLFLYNLHASTHLASSLAGELSDSRVSRHIDTTRLADRIRHIFYISVANFVFPLIFNIAQIVSVATDHSPTTGAVLVLINNYVTVMGVLCATLWFSGTERVRAHNQTSSNDMFLLNARLGRLHGGSGKSGDEILVIGGRSVIPDVTGSNARPTKDSNQHTTLVQEENYNLA